LHGDLHGRWRQATRDEMVLLSLHGLPAAQIAVLLDCHPATVRRWIGRFNREGTAGLADRPRCGRPRLGGRQLTRRIAALLARPGPWTPPRIRRYLGWPQVSMRPGVPVGACKPARDGCLLGCPVWAPTTMRLSTMRSFEPSDAPGVGGRGGPGSPPPPAIPGFGSKPRAHIAKRLVGMTFRCLA
jgi:hypothetical protein